MAPSSLRRSQPSIATSLAPCAMRVITAVSTLIGRLMARAAPAVASTASSVTSVAAPVRPERAVAISASAWR